VRRAAGVPPRGGATKEASKSARYRNKDETDLVWNRIRRQITRDLDTEIQNKREEVLNILLTKAWEDYTTSLESGELVELEGKYRTLVAAIVADVVPKHAHLDDGS
jgi:hypothetical protein